MISPNSARRLLVRFPVQLTQACWILMWNAPPNLASKAAITLLLIRPVARPSTSSALRQYRRDPARLASVVSAPPSQAPSSSPPMPPEEQPVPYRLPEPFSSNQQSGCSRGEDALI